MSWLKATARQVVALFADDESFVTIIVVWLVLFGVLAVTTPKARVWGALLLLAGVGTAFAHTALNRRRK